MMAGEIAAVEAFLAMWSEPGGLDAAIRLYFREDTVWENVGMATTTGVDEALALNAGLEGNFGIASIGVENLAVAQVGNKVLTERIDTMLGAGGTVIGAFPVMGIFEMDGDKIAAWRDYFDTKGAFDFG
jgi:limonene-1,2-epoxide hydrolase